MRTSRVSRETAHALQSLSSSSTLNGSSSTPFRALRNFMQSSPKVKDEPNSDSDLSSPEDSDESYTHSAFSKTSIGKRKRGSNSTPRNGTPARSVKVKTESLTSAATSAPAKAKAPRRQPAKKKVDASGVVKVDPPSDWEEVYAHTLEMRRRIPAPVDTMGCDKLADRAATPRDQRFQTLVALMLSSQTKDTVTSVTIRSLQENLPGGLTLESILAIEPEKLNEMIWSIGFHNTKTKNIKLAAEILKEKFGGDIPDTIEGLMSLPGVGPKMGYLCLSSAWGRDEGIGVDVHVHRITNLWKWHQTKTPEETRVALQAWLPREKWHEINWLLVGFGQSICLPVGRKCGECTLAKKGLCPSVVGVKRVKREAKMEIKIEGESGADVNDEVKVETETAEEFPMKEEDGTAPDVEDFGSTTRRSSRRGRDSR